MTLSLTPNRGIARPLGRHILNPLRAEDKPPNAVRLLTVDISAWANQAPADPPATLATSVFPDLESALQVTDPVLTGSTAAAMVSGGTEGVEYAIDFTISTQLGRVETFRVALFISSLSPQPIG